MAKKSAIRIALDLETTGLHPEQDAILEVAAIKFQDHEIVEKFETFVAPGRPIPFRVQRLTGIKPEHLIGAPSFSAIAKKLQVFLGDYPIVGHSIPFDVSFLRQRGLARTNPLIDTFELATVLLPSLASYNLGQVGLSLGVHVPDDRHRAMVDTILAMEVFLALHQRLLSLDLDLLNDLSNLDAPRSWPLLHFFRQVLRERQESEGVYGRLSRGSLGDRFAAQLGMDPRVLSFAVGHSTAPASSPASSAPSAPVETKTRVAGDPLPALSSSPRFDYQSARSCVQGAFAQHTSALLEVTVGDGQDYIPALLPALEWLVTAELHEPETASRRLVIACANQQQVRRVSEITLPHIQARLQTQLPVAILAEHGGYLCTHRWFGAALRRTSGELTAEQARGLAKLRLWTHLTLTGERSELTLLQQEMSAWERISSGYEQLASNESRLGSSYQHCMYRRKGYCFVSLAEERVRAARIVVTTHAGLFDDLSRANSLLHDIANRVVLDADLLDEENFRWGSAELDQNRLFQILNTLGTELPDGRYQGLLALAAPALRENGPGGLSRTQTVAKSELDQRLLRWFQALRQARQAVERLFASFAALLDEYVQQGVSSGGGHESTKGRDDKHRSHGGRGHERIDQPLRLAPHIRHLSAWNETELAWQQVSQRLQTVIDHAHEAEKIILSSRSGRNNRFDVGSGEESSVAAELTAVASQLVAQKRLGQHALIQGESDVVYWLRMPPVSVPSLQPHSRHNESPSTSAVPSLEQAPVLHAQLIQISPVLKRLLLTEGVGTIFAGSALSVDSSFSFIRNRLGLEHENCESLSIEAEHHEQTLLYLPNDVPEPNAPQYQRHLDEALIHLATALEGQVVVLFTSHAALRSTYASIKPQLEARGILVLGQGVDGSPRQLWQVYHSQERVVLLGTGSFWDGIEEITRPPSCLVVARLPMPVLNDPPIAARVEQYSDQLHQLTVPMAAQRVRRVLNRLTWCHTRRNVVVLFDRRITTKEYGATVLHSLPRCSQRQDSVSHMPETVLDWLTDTGSWEDSASS